MLVFASFCPHAPILIPEIGKGETKKVKNTIKALEILSKDIEIKEPETIVVISPHALVYPDRINIIITPKLAGDFAQFNHDELKFEFKNDLELIEKITEICEKENFPLVFTDNREVYFELDHGTLVPLYFLTKNFKPNIISLAYSYQEREKLFDFGKFLFRAIQSVERPVALIGSGDLSHRLIFTAPAGFSAVGKEFDQKIIEYLKSNQVEKILEMDEDFIEEAGECGYRSLIILLGALSSISYQIKVLSYEGPFGVGYAVVKFDLK